MTFAVNYLAPFLLTNLLLDVLKNSAPTRIINIASDNHRFVRFDMQDLQLKRHYGFLRAYGRSKLALLLFTYELARQLQERASRSMLWSLARHRPLLVRKALALLLECF